MAIFKYFKVSLQVYKEFTSVILLLTTLQLSTIRSYAQVPNPIPGAYPVTGTVNYVRTWTATAPEQSATNLITRPLSDVKQTTEYSDGFGRPIQTVTMKASPLGNDIVTADTYDPATGNEVYKYLPFTANIATAGDLTSDGNFKSDRFQEQVAFYNTYLTGQPNETNVGASSLNWAYSHTNYESSPLNRVLNCYAPGSSWVGSEGAANHNVQQASWVNVAADNVQIWTISTTKASPEVFPQAQIIPTNNGAYTAGQLYKVVITDEQGHQAIEFKDKYGQVILKKVQNTASADNETGSAHAGWLCTYYVYDDYGNLRFIIPPNVVQLIDGNWNGITQSYVDELCYYFEYDNLNRMVIKKTPGTPSGVLGEVWMVYDERNRLVMQQDGYQRSNKLWKYIQYDGLDRITATGLLTDPSSNTTNYSDLNSHLNSAAASTSWPVLSSYTTELLSQIFYDNYTWMNSTNSSTLPSTINTTAANGSANLAFTTSYNTSPNYPQKISQSNMIHGMAVGGKTEVMGSNQSQYLYAVSFFDSKGRVIQTQSINYMQGTDISTSQFAWDGRLLSNLVSHNISSTKTSNPQSHWITSVMAYSTMGRLNTVTKTISSTVNGIAVSAKSSQIVSNQYNELGQLQKATLGNNLETLSYDYNVRGWLLGENRTYLSGSSSNHFGFELAYDKTTSVASGNTYNAPEFNGNVTGTTWKSVGDGVNRKFDYSYDNMNRLISSPFRQNSTGSTWDNSPIDFSVSNLSYDGNGNIASMQQNGYLVGGSQTIDNLTYSYINGKNSTTNANYTNRLLNVMDASNNASSTLGDFHYPSSKPTTGNTDYTYDANGNITSDYNRSISTITYWKDLNIPNTLTITGKGTIQYTYDAAGNKLQKVVTENNAPVKYNGSTYTSNIITTTRYIDGFVYKTVNYTNSSLSALNSNNVDVFQFTGQEEGRIRFKPALGAVPAGYAFDYFIKDNLGNVRMILTDETSQDTYPAATVETLSYGGGVAEATESLYYNINASDIKVTATSLPWFAGLPNSSYLNTNVNPANPNPYSDPTSYSKNVYWLNGQTGDKTGLGITLKVVAGDSYSIFGKSVWHNPNGGTVSYQPITSALSTFLAGFANASNGSSIITHGVTGTQLSSVGTTTTPLTPLLNGTPNNGNQPNGSPAPKAAINWMLFDDQFRPVSVGTSLVSTSPDQIYTHPISLSIPVTKSGYLYVYCSNESNMDVYFDNLQVVLTHGPLVEETHYYPSGLTMAGISDKAFGKQQNYFHYQDKEMQNQEWYDGTGFEEYDFHARYYDQQLGVWHNQDPVGQFASPYLAMSNNWQNGIDSNGKSWVGNILKSPWEDIKIVAGLFVWNKHESFGNQILDFFSRITWQLPQEALGLGASIAQNHLGLVNKVRYFDGVTALNTTYLTNDVPYVHSGTAFTLGSYTSGPSKMQLNASDPTFQHEYGRYLQSKADGLTYLTFTAIPDLFSEGNDGPTATDANARALIYFNKYHGGLQSATNPTGFTWNFLNNENPIDGYNPNLSIDDPINSAALKGNMRRPGFLDHLEADSDLFLLGLLVF